MERKELAFALTWQRNTEPVGAAVNESASLPRRELGRRSFRASRIAYDELLPCSSAARSTSRWLPPLAFLRLGRSASCAPSSSTSATARERSTRCSRCVREAGTIRSTGSQGARAAWVDPYSTRAMFFRGSTLRRAARPARRRSRRSAFSDRTTLPRARSSKGGSDVSVRSPITRATVVRAGFSTTGTASDWRIILRGRESPSDVLAAPCVDWRRRREGVKGALTRALADETTAHLVREVLHVDAFGGRRRRQLRVARRRNRGSPPRRAPTRHLETTNRA